MSMESPQVDEISADGQFRWDGQGWSPLARGHREPTSWTLPLQRAAAVYLAVMVLWSLASNAMFVSVARYEQVIRATIPSMPADQVPQAARLDYAIGWVTITVLSVVFLVLVAGSLRRWRWAFWGDLVALVLIGIGVVTNAVALASAATQTLPAGAMAVNLALSVVALALLVWFIVAAVRFGPWAMRRPRAGTV